MGLFSGLFFGCGCGPCPPRPDKMIGPLPDGGADDDGIPDKTEEFGHLIQEQKSEDRRKEHLHIVKDGDLLGGRLAVCRGDAELSARRVIGS